MEKSGKLAARHKQYGSDEARVLDPIVLRQNARRCQHELQGTDRSRLRAAERVHGYVLSSPLQLRHHPATRPALILSYPEDVDKLAE